MLVVLIDVYKRPKQSIQFICKVNSVNLRRTNDYTRGNAKKTEFEALLKSTNPKGGGAMLREKTLG